jgi:hypothetical protein
MTFVTLFDMETDAVLCYESGLYMNVEILIIIKNTCFKPYVELVTRKLYIKVQWKQLHFQSKENPFKTQCLPLSSCTLMETSHPINAV